MCGSRAQAILIPYTGSLDHMSSEPSSVKQEGLWYNF